MSSDDSPRTTKKGALGEILVAIREDRGLSKIEVARRMGLSERAYGRFEASDLWHTERVFAFGNATNCDALGIFLALILGRPELAIRVSRNKLALMMMEAFSRLDEKMGDDLALLEAGPFLNVVTNAMVQFGLQARETEDIAQIVIEGRFPSLTVSDFYARYRKAKPG
ncbi:helix-turn-helix domain-containing protein [Caulobacter sp. NIBR2454]|uniref:helix-turn-helix domain-containing protein n=1 Tax=Caulobacter sp. NIBR2454 TaxID=3015996 RepID=UPI0022B5F948|nr:helix-turn-helix transcriptional regulator [Caulobacter sp. NIBR2454]